MKARSVRLAYGMFFVVSLTGCHVIMNWKESPEKAVGTAQAGGSGGSGGIDASAGGTSGSAGAAGQGPMGGTAGSAGAAAQGGGGQGSVGGSSGTAGQAGASGSAGAGGSGEAIQYGTPGPSCDDMIGTECMGYNCCANILVPGGTLPMGRSYDGSDKCPDEFNCDYAQDEQPEHDANVSSFYLDMFEVTVGRFRQFLENYDNWQKPKEGDGAHPVLVDSGWKSGWNTYLPANKDDFLTQLNEQKTNCTWTDTVGNHELLPINRVTWYEAMAFCIWDGGMLPTEAEWEYAAAGGDENRLYPWGSLKPSAKLAAFDCQYHAPSTCSFGDLPPVGTFPLGAGRWKHRDLAGSMYEWTLDWYNKDKYKDGTCNNCSNLASDVYRVLRGGSWYDKTAHLRAVDRRADVKPIDRKTDVGIRCARFKL